MNIYNKTHVNEGTFIVCIINKIKHVHCQTYEFILLIVIGSFWTPSLPYLQLSMDTILPIELIHDSNWPFEFHQFLYYSSVEHNVLG